MALTLYSSKSWRTAGTKVEVLATILGIELQLNRISPAEWKSPEYLQKHPLGKIPTLDTPQGPIFQSLAIMRYLARKAGQMYGNTPAQTASIDQWLQYFNTQLYPCLYTVYSGIFGSPTTKEHYDGRLHDVNEMVKVIDGYLKDNQFLGSKELSIADVVYGWAFLYYFRLIMDEKHRNTHPNFTKWIIQIYNHPAFAKHFGKLWLCQKQFIPEFELPKEEVKLESKQQPKKQPKQVKQGAKKQQPKKEPKKEAKKETKKQEKKKKEQSDEDQPKQEKKKQANPLDLLPKSTFVIDDFKREFVNAPDRVAVLKNMWEKFDNEGWSIWKTHYIKYEGEGVVGYLTANLKNGFLRNLDHFRKYTFGVMGVYGTDGNFQIDGAFIWRGTQIPNEWKEHQSYDYFTFTKLNPADKEQQQLVEDYWLKLNQGDIVDGHPVFQAKWFK